MNQNCTTRILFIFFILTFLSLKGFAQCNADAGPNVSFCTGDSVQLGDTPAANGTAPFTYSWSPATNLSCTNCPNPICTATTSTVYILTITDDTGCTDSDNVNVTVDPSPMASFTFSPNNGCASVPVVFNSTSTGTNLNYEWNFGNPASGAANTSSQADPIHEFISVGGGTQSFTVTLIVSNNNGCADTVIQTVTVSQSPGAALLDPITSFKNCDGTTFNMTVYDGSGTTGNSNYTVVWGDGSPNYSSSTFPGGGLSHLYSSSDIFDLEYIVTGPNGCSDTMFQLVSNITNPAIGAANPGATTGCGPITLCFPLSNYATNHSSTYYVVDYGDGSPNDTLPHPPPAVLCHTYTQSSCGQPGNAFTFAIKAVNSCDISLASISPIRVYTGPLANFTPNPVNACVGSPVLFLNSTIPGFNSTCSGSTLYTWNFGDGATLTSATLTNPSHAYASPGTYTVTLTTQNACSTINHIETVCIENPPVPSFTITTDTACVPFTTQISNLSTTLNTCVVNYTWSVLFNGSTCLPSAGTWSFINGTNATSFAPEFQFSSPGQYTIRLTMVNSCGTFIYNQTVIGQAPPQISLAALTSICAGNSVNPSATSNNCYETIDLYSWTFSGGSPSFSAALTPGAILYSTPGAYTIQLQATNQCGTITGSTPLTVFAPPVANAGLDVQFCSGGSSLIGSNAVAGVTYSWNPVIGLNSGAISNPTLTLTNGTATPIVNPYVLTASSSVTCFNRDTVLVTVNPIPVMSVNSPIICFGQSANLNASGAGVGGTYNWNVSPTLSCLNCDNPNADPSVTTTYTVIGTNTYNCQSSTTSTVTVNPLPIVNAGPDQNLCDQPVPVTLNGMPAGGTWSGSPNVTSGGIFTPNGSENSVLYYSYSNPVTGCSNLDSIIVIVNPPIIPTVDPFDSLCINLSNVNLFTQLNAIPATGTFSGTGVSGNNFNPSIAGLGTHQIIYSVGTSTCQSTDTAYIKVNPQPSISVNNVTICFGDSANLIANGAGIGGNYSWNPSTSLSCSTCASTFSFPSATTTYTISGINVYGCSNNTTSTVTVNPLPIVNAGPDALLCDQPISTTFTGSPGGGSWTGSLNITSFGVFIPSGTEVSNLIYSYTNPSTLCSSSDTLIVTVNPAITPIVDPSTSVCFNDPSMNLNTLLNSNPSTGTWSGTGVSNPNFSPSSAGVGTFTLTYSYGSGSCQTIVSSDITVDPQPNILVNSGTICNGDTIELIASGAGVGGNYSWDPVTALSCTNCSNTLANPTSTTVYTVVGTNTFGCSNAINSTVIVNSLALVNAGPDLLLCDQPVATTLNGSPAGGIWTGSVNVTSGGIFTPNGTEISTLVYTYFDPSTGCQNMDSMVVTVNPPIIPTLDPNYSICIYEPSVNLNVALNVNPAGGTWSGMGINNPNFNPALSGVGIFTATYTYGTGTCQTIITSEITVNPQPIISVNSATICDGQNALMNASGAGVGGNYFWSPATNLSCISCPDPIANPSNTITYSVSGTTANGCSNTANSIITVNPLPIVNAGPDTVLCNLPTPVQLNGTIAGGIWTGSNISGTGLFSPNGIGNFTVTYTVTLGTGCTQFDSRIIQVIDPTISNAGPDLESCINDPVTNLNGTPVGGTWTGTSVTISGIFTPSVVGAFPIIYSTGAGNCLNKDTMVFTVHSLPIVNVGADLDFCLSDAQSNLNSSPSGGTWSGTGIVNPSLGTFDPSNAGVGLHTLVYTFVDPLTSCLNRDTLVADVHPLPAVSFTYNPIVCLGVSEVFTNTSTLANSNAWNFGDMGNSSNFSPSHSYLTTGFFTVELIVTSPFGCMDSLSQNIEVREPPVADFSILPDSACGPVLVSFTNNSSGIAVSYNWDFGNGQSNTSQNPASMTYFAGILADTSYLIELEVTNFCGTVSHAETVIVMPVPTAIFGSDFNTFCSPFTANFASTSLGLPDSYYWDFGNGNTSSTTDSLFQQTFTTGSTPTDYIIMLVVLNECGTDTAYHTITVTPNNVNAFFNTSATTSCFDLTVDFTQYTLGGTIWSWDFGDGTSSSAYSPSHVYPNPGTYDVSLFANDGCSFDTTTVTITVNEPPTVAFTYTPDSACINLPFYFINQSVDAVSSFWDFGDGTTSSMTNPSHLYLNSGDYLVTLTGTSLINGCTSTVTENVHVSVNPIAQFIPLPISGCVPLNVQFDNQSSGTVFQSWDFGDGNTSGLFSPNHTFTSTGIYTVQLLVENVNGCLDSVSQNITVHPLPVADFSTTYNCTNPVSVDFTNQSSGGINYFWDFGNGQTSNLNNPSIDFNLPGTYTVALNVSNQYGCTDVFTQDIIIYPIPSLTFSLPIAVICANDDLEFYATTSNIDSIYWDMGDGTILLGDTIYYAYSVPGNYFVTAIGYGGGGCISSVASSSSIVVNPDAIADFEYENVLTEDPANGTVQFTNQSLFANSFFWDFGDGESSSELNPLHVFAGSGLSSTTLYASNQFGCNDSITIEVDIDYFDGLFLPNAIYPGHTNYEISHFIPKGVGLKEFELLIYDDWGNLIWSTTALDANGRPTEAWDGTFNGEPVQQDAYVWKATGVFLNESAWEGQEYKNGRFKKSGTVTVIR